MREVGILKKDPEQLKKQIDNLEMMSKLSVTMVLHLMAAKFFFDFLFHASVPSLHF